MLYKALVSVNSSLKKLKRSLAKAIPLRARAALASTIASKTAIKTICNSLEISTR